MDFIKNQTVLLMGLCLLLTTQLKGQQRSVLNTASRVNTDLIFNTGEAASTRLQAGNLVLYQGFIMPVTIPTSPLPEQLGIQVENSMFPEVRFWPNPVASGRLLTISGADLQLRSIRLWSTQGVLMNNWVYESQELSNTKDIQLLLNQKSGLYVVEIKTSLGTVKKKIIIQ